MSPPLLRANDIPLDVIRELGQSVVEVVGEKRATWRRWNLYAEAARQTMGWRFASTTDREAIVGMVADAAVFQEERIGEHVNRLLQPTRRVVRRADVHLARRTIGVEAARHALDGALPTCALGVRARARGVCV